MPTRSSDRTQWLVFPCPSCRAKLRIKAAYAAQRGRCPECGYRIEPRTTTSDSLSCGHALTDATDEPGLVPIDDEWPEPAQVIEREEGRDYALAPEREPPVEPTKSLNPRAETFTVAADDLPPPRMHSLIDELEGPNSSARLDAAEARRAALPDPKDVEALLPDPPPPPPPYPMWSGIYTFPWRPDNLGVWLYQALNFAVLALIATAMVAVYRLGGVYMIGIVLLIPLMGLVFLWTGIYASSNFLANVEDTAAGNDRVGWPHGGGLIDGLGRFVYLLFMAAVSFIPVLLIITTEYATTGGRAGALAGHGGEPTISLAWILPISPWVLLYPVLFLSALSAGSIWKVLDGRIVGGLIRHPKALFLLTVPSLGVIVASLAIAQAFLVYKNFALAAAAGPVWSTAHMIYGRLLGRAGWMITETRPKRKRKRERPPRVKVTPVADAGWDEMSE